MRAWSQPVGALALLIVALVTALLGQPSAEDRAARWQAELDELVASRAYHIDPGEVFDLLYDTKLKLILLDVRGEAEYNLFHLVDAERVTPASLDAAYVRELPEGAVIVTMSNDERRAEEAFRLLKAQGAANVYVLGGGLNLWLEVYDAGRLETQVDPAHPGDDRLRYPLSAALGDMHPASRPPIETTPRREYVRKVELEQPGPKVQGGCG